MPDGVNAFVPQDSVAVTVGKQVVCLYPKIQASMGARERACGYHVTVAALRILKLGPKLLLDTLGNQSNCSTIVDGLKSDWMLYFDNHWLNWKRMSILSFHNLTG